jgi:hypothetical protein
MTLHILLTEYPPVVLATKTHRDATALVDGARDRDRAAFIAWESQSVATARRGEPSPARPEPTPDNVIRGFRDEETQASQAAKAVLRDVAQEVTDELVRRQGEVLDEVETIRARLVLLAIELSDLGGTATHLDRAGDAGVRGHLTNIPDPSELLKLTAAGTVWVQA